MEKKRKEFKNNRPNLIYVLDKILAAYSNFVLDRFVGTEV